jgi:hypothetical protein
MSFLTLKNMPIFQNYFEDTSLSGIRVVDCTVNPSAGEMWVRYPTE